LKIKNILMILILSLFTGCGTTGDTERELDIVNINEVQENLAVEVSQDDVEVLPADIRDKGNSNGN